MKKLMMLAILCTVSATMMAGDCCSTNTCSTNKADKVACGGKCAEGAKDQKCSCGKKECPKCAKGETTAPAPAKS